MDHSRFSQGELIMSKLLLFVILVLVLTTLPVYSQSDSTSAQQPVPAMVSVDSSTAPAESYNPETSGDRMMMPPPVSGQTYPVMLASEQRSNYIRAGLSFTGMYSDNVLGTTGTGSTVSDQSYSIGPVIALDETTPRMHTSMSYAPGFTFYQHTSSRNEADHNASMEFEYRLSPHVTFSAMDSFHKSSNVLNQPPGFSAGGVVSGGAQGPISR